MRDWDDEFANMAHIEGSNKLPAYWATEGAAYREKVSPIQTLAYGTAERETVDWVMPDAEPKGLVVFVHGGYWMRTSPSDWTHLAEGARARGWAVAMVGYTLAPQASVTQITQQVSTAVTFAANHVSGPIILTGHSAGGHLVTRLLCSDTALSSSVLNRIVHTLPISGVFDLRPLLWTQMNDVLKLSDAEAIAASPVLHRPMGAPQFTFWVGAEERPEFIRQNRLMCTMWDGLGAKVSLVEDPGKHHFSVIEAMRDPSSTLINVLFDV